MAETVHLYLKSNGTDINGESTQTSLGRETVSYTHLTLPTNREV